MAPALAKLGGRAYTQPVKWLSDQGFRWTCDDMSDSARHERREVLYRGQVQGVGFRFRCREIAGRFAVTGFVQNLPDGRVKLVVEGNAGELDRYLVEVAAELADHIRQADTARGPATGEFPQFGIRH